MCWAFLFFICSIVYCCSKVLLLDHRAAFFGIIRPAYQKFWQAAKWWLWPAGCFQKIAVGWLCKFQLKKFQLPTWAGVGMKYSLSSPHPEISCSPKIVCKHNIFSLKCFSHFSSSFVVPTPFNINLFFLAEICTMAARFFPSSRYFLGRLVARHNIFGSRVFGRWLIWQLGDLIVAYALPISVPFMTSHFRNLTVLTS